MVGKQLTSIHVLSGRYIKKPIENMSKPVGEEVLEIDVKGKLIVIYFRNAAKFKERYALLGFQDNANLDDGSVWPVAYAIKELTAADEKKIRSLVKKAVA